MSGMTERPMLFSGPMVRALLEDRKTMTRRIVKPQPVDGDRIQWDKHVGAFQCGRLRDSENAWRTIQCPHGNPGDQLWVRETCKRWFLPNILTGEPTAIEAAQYAADQEPCVTEDGFDLVPWWKGQTCSPIHMPRWASRITLEIAEVRVERLQDISEADTRAEGVRYHEASHVWGDGRCFRTAIEAFGQLWDSLNGKTASWASNPWVWVISVRRIPQDRSHGAQLPIPI